MIIIQEKKTKKELQKLSVKVVLNPFIMKLILFKKRYMYIKGEIYKDFDDVQVNSHVLHKIKLLLYKKGFFIFLLLCLKI